MKDGELGVAILSKPKARQELSPVRVGIAGLGRSGWGIHAEAIADMAKISQHFELVAVTDADSARCAEAKARFGCRVHESVADLVADESVELVVVATPNHLHAAHAIAAMQAGKHVLCEKPMATTVAEAQSIAAAAKHSDGILTVFNNRRFDPHFLKVREIVDSGVLGRMVQVRLVVHQFTRRWDWQTLTKYGGGMLNNIGAHFLDQLLSFFPSSDTHDDLPEVHCHLDRVLTLGDADDHCVVSMRRPGYPLVQLELTNACGMPQDNWLIMGDRGTLGGTFEHLRWCTMGPLALPPRILQTEPSADDRRYNRDHVQWNRHEWRVPPGESTNRFNHAKFYDRLFHSLRQNAPLEVTPKQVERCMRLIAACHVSAESSSNANRH